MSADPRKGELERHFCPEPADRKVTRKFCRSSKRQEIFIAFIRSNWAVTPQSTTMQNIIGVLCLLGLFCTVQGSWMWQQSCGSTEWTFVYNTSCIKDGNDPSIPWRSMKCAGSSVFYKSCSRSDCSNCFVRTIRTAVCDDALSTITYCGEYEPDYGQLVQSNSYALLKSSQDKCNTFSSTAVYPLGRCMATQGDGGFITYECKNQALIQRVWDDASCQNLSQITEDYVLNQCILDGNTSVFAECYIDGQKIGNWKFCTASENI